MRAAMTCLFRHGSRLRARTLLTNMGRCGQIRAESSAAAATEAVLRSGDAGPSLAALKTLTAALPPQPVSLAMLLGSARDRSARTRLNNAKFLRRELTARRAHVLQLLHSMPSPLAEQPAVARLARVYWERLHSLLVLPQIETEADEREFAEIMRKQNEMIHLDPILIQMCVDALSECQGGGDRLPPEAQLAVDRHLDAIFLARIGMRFLLEHYVASEASAEGFAGIIAKKCSPVALCESLAAQTRERLTAEYGRAPPIEVLGDTQWTFTFVPSHFCSVVGKLLHNSCVATLRHIARKQEQDAPLPPVRVVVAMSDLMVQAKLIDEAGGMRRSLHPPAPSPTHPSTSRLTFVAYQHELVPNARPCLTGQTPPTPAGIRRSSLPKVWSYRALDSKWWKPADGLSLPLARLYCHRPIRPVACGPRPPVTGASPHPLAPQVL